MHRLLASLGLGVIVALTISVLGFSLITMFRHEWLYEAEPLVCPEGTTLELRNASPVPGELVLEADCTGEGVTHDATSKLIFTVIGILFLPSLLLGTFIGWARG